MAVPSEFIDEVLSRCDIVAIVREYVNLTQRGSEFKGLCPFHGEKTPSFTVSQEKNVYHCFGCSAGGGVINFVMEAEGLEFIQAVEFLANRVGLSMPENSYDDGRNRALQEKIFQMNRIAARFFYQNIQTPSGKEALDYLLNRGLSPQTLTRFGVGFAPNQWDGLLRFMMAQGYSDFDLLEGGLATQSKSSGKILDRFRNRIMFPIVNVKKEVIGFGGRIMDDSQPKYLNSPDTAVFNKSKNLYGINLAKKAKGTGILTEGYMDTIALHQGGFTGAVASLGTAFTEGQAMLMKKYFKNLILAYDGDGAGQSATERAIPILDKVGLEVRVLQMTGAKDPDEFIKKYGANSFAHLLNQSVHHVDYRLSVMKGKYNLEDNNHRVRFLQDAVTFLTLMESPIQREIYATKVGEWVSVSKDAVLLEVEKELRQKTSRNKRKMEKQVLQAANTNTRRSLYDYSRASRAEEGLVRVSLLDPTLLGELLDFTAEVFSVPLLGRVFEQLKARYQKGEVVALNNLASQLSAEEMAQMVQVVHEQETVENLHQAMLNYLNVMEEQFELRSLQGEDKLLAMQKRMQERQE